MITGIKIKIKDKEIELTKEEALELRKDLDELLGVKGKEYIPYPCPYPVSPKPYNPLWYSTPWTIGDPPTEQPFTITCGGNMQ